MRISPARLALGTTFMVAATLLCAAAGLISAPIARATLFAVAALSAAPMFLALARSALSGNFGADLLAGIAVVVALVAGEQVIAAVVVVMWSGGQALEAYATRRASRVLEALAERNPSVAHRQVAHRIVDVPLAEVQPGDRLVVLPHEICPADGVVEAGASTMDESLISGEPYRVRKTVGVTVISGARNGDSALTIVATSRPEDSRFARIIGLVRDAELGRPEIRRLADRLGAWYTPLALTVAAAAWALSGDAGRFLAVLVIATPCPLLLGVPVALICAVSAAAERSIVIRDTSVFERIGACRTVVFDKTGTLTLGQPVLTDVQVLVTSPSREELLALAASVEQYSKHPLAAAVVEAAARAGVRLHEAESVSERPGEGLVGRAGNRSVRITGRRQLAADLALMLPAGASSGLECVVVVDDVVSAVLRFEDVPRTDSAPLVGHLKPRHRFERVLLVSGDRESEVRHLAELMGIEDVYFSQTPEQKVAIVRAEQRTRSTLFIGDGLNDAPAMVAADVAVAIGRRVDATTEAAGAVILDDALSRVDDLLHLSARTRRIALQSAVGGMLLSLVGMGLAAAGWLAPMGGVFAQEAIDIAAVVNALRAAFPPVALTDYRMSRQREHSNV